MMKDVKQVSLHVHKSYLHVIQGPVFFNPGLGLFFYNTDQRI